MKSLHHTLKSYLSHPKNNHILNHIFSFKTQRETEGEAIEHIDQYLVDWFNLLSYIVVLGRRMHISSKSLYYVIVSFYVSIIPFTQCSSLEEIYQFGIQKNTNKNVLKVNNQKSNDIAMHGLLLWGSIGFLMPLGILTIRGINKADPGTRRSRGLFYLHVVFQMLSVLLATFGAAMSLKKLENSFDNNHQRVGLALYGAILVQAFIGFFRPHRGKKERSYWYLVHWLLGTTVSLVGIINIYTGLKAYHKRTLKSTRFWTILFTVEVIFIGLIYLFQDKMEYMKKQRVIEGSETTELSFEDIIPQRQNQKELLPVACEKINALKNLFDS